MRRAVLLIAVLSVLAGPAPAQTSITAPGVTATITPSVSPTRLPARGAAPVKVTLDGSITCAEGCAGSLRAFKVRLDQQITSDTTGLPTCQVRDIERLRGADKARRRCGRALIGTGTATETIVLPPQPPLRLRLGLLFFNAGRGGAVVTYAYMPGWDYDKSEGFPGVDSYSVGTIRDLAFRMGSGIPRSEFSFHLTFGKTWRHKGKRHSYLKGRCGTGSLKSRVTLELSSGSASEVVAQPCGKRG